VTHRQDPQIFDLLFKVEVDAADGAHSSASDDDERA
jgi:hypothetical protein